MWNTRNLLIGLALFGLAGEGVAHAEVTDTVWYDGSLFDGDKAASGTFDVRFELFRNNEQVVHSFAAKRTVGLFH